MPKVTISSQVFRQILADYLHALGSDQINPATISWHESADAVVVTYQSSCPIVPDEVATLEDMRALGRLLAYALDDACVGLAMRGVSALNGLDMQFFIRTIEKWGITAGLHEGISSNDPKLKAEQTLGAILKHLRDDNPLGLVAAAGEFEK